MIEVGKAIRLLKRGQMVVLPTETVYGLAASAYKAHAVRKIFRIKGRPSSRPLIVHYGSKPLWKRDCIWTEEAEVLAQNFWPGPLTMILRRNPSSPLCAEVSGFGKSLAVRRSSQIAGLCDACGPLAAPSANLYQKLSTTTRENAQKQLPKIPILRGPRSRLGLESTIIDLTRTSPYPVYRVGSLGIDELQKFLDCRPAEGQNTPGSGKHYQPDKPLRLEVREVFPGEALLCFGRSDLKAEWALNLSPNGNLSEAEHNLYYMLQALSETGCNGIAVPPLPKEARGIRDRLERGAKKDTV